MRWTYILLFLSVCFTYGIADDCGPNRRCTCGNSIMDCRKMDLTQFPDKVGDDIKAIYLNDNKLKSLTQIPEESELQTLVLTGNQISSLRYDTFDNLDNLKTLYLSNNSISVIADDIFEWNPLKLEVLYLDGNKLEFIQHFLFYDLEELTDLYLQNNEIVFVHPHAFLQLKSLRNLRLDGNKLHTFNHKWIDKLAANMFNELRFDNNPWSCDCAMNQSLGWLNGSNGKNGKKKLPTWFLDLHTTHPIVCTMPTKLSGKGLETLQLHDINAFCDLPKITGISTPSSVNEGRDVLLRCVLEDGVLPKATISWTAPNEDVYRLNTAINYDGIEVHTDGSLLISNLTNGDDGPYTCTATNMKGSIRATTRLKVVPGKAPSLKPTATADTVTPDEHITAVQNKKCPSGCQCISRHIDCSSDGSSDLMDSVPADIPKDAITITLAGNELTTVHASDFTSFPKLEELRLDNNKISIIGSQAFVFNSYVSSLTTLTLQENELTKISKGTFAQLKKLNVLVLDKNRLTRLKRGMFQGLIELQWLYVRHNLISTIDADAFVDLVKIRFIHLESNILQVLPVAPFKPKPQPSLTKIFVDDNNFQCDCHMEDIRTLIRNSQFKTSKPDFFGDGIMCSYPPNYLDKNLEDIADTLVCDNLDVGVNIDLAQQEVASRSSGLLFGGIAVGVILAFVIIILWRKYGRTVRTGGRSYNYSNLKGNDEAEKHSLTSGAAANGQEAFV